jgi:hypothetical protein
MQRVATFAKAGLALGEDLTPDNLVAMCEPRHGSFTVGVPWHSDRPAKEEWIASPSLVAFDRHQYKVSTNLERANHEGYKKYPHASGHKQYPWAWVRKHGLGSADEMAEGVKRWGQPSQE